MYFGVSYTWLWNSWKYSFFHKSTLLALVFHQMVTSKLSQCMVFFCTPLSFFYFFLPYSHSALFFLVMLKLAVFPRLATHIDFAQVYVTKHMPLEPYLQNVCQKIRFQLIKVVQAICQALCQFTSACLHQRLTPQKLLQLLNELGVHGDTAWERVFFWFFLVRCPMCSVKNVKFSVTTACTTIIESQNH